MKKVVCLLISAVLILGCMACTKKDDNQSKNVVNVSEEGVASFDNMSTIQKPEGIEIIDFLCYLKDGTLRIGGSDLNGTGQSIWDSQDNGKSWKCTVDAGSMPQIVQPGVYYKCSSQGDLYSCDGTTINIDSEKWSGKSIDIQDADGTYIDSALISDRIYVLLQGVSGEKKLWNYKLDTQQGSQVESETLMNCVKKAKGGGCIASDITGKILYAEGNGIIKYDVEADKVSTLLDENYLEESINVSNEPILGLAVNEEKGIVLRTRNMEAGNDNLYFFAKGKTSEKKAEGKSDSQSIEVYSLKENSMIRQSLAFFRRNHADILVSYTVGYTGEDGVSLSDAVRNLNTAILAGEGPDILVLDNLPAEQYVEKDVLEDVSSIVEEVKDNLYYNIITHSNKGDGIYMVPTTFTIPAILGNKEVTEAGNTEDMVGQMNAQKGVKAAIPAKDFSAAAVSLFVTSGLVDGEIDADGLMQFYKDLQTLKELCDADSGDMGQSLLEKAEMFPYIYYPVGLEIYLGNAQAGITVISSGDSYIELKSVENQMNLNVDYLNKNTGNCYIPSEILGVNHMSSQKEAAKDFLKMYLTEEVQDTNTMGFSVNRASMKKQIQITDPPQYYTTLYENMGDSEGLGLYTLSSEEFEALSQMAEDADTPVSSDAVILNTVMEQAEQYLFEGKKLEDAVDAACDKINLYLKE